MKARTLLVLATLVGACGPLYEPDRPPEKVLLPDGFVGWTRLDYGVEGAPALPREGASVVIRYPADGHAVTSSVLSGTYGLSTVFYYSRDVIAPVPSGFRRNGGFTRRNGKDLEDRISFFSYFGTEADAAEAAQVARDPDADPLLGSIFTSRRVLHQGRP